MAVTDAYTTGLGGRSLLDSSECYMSGSLKNNHFCCEVIGCKLVNLRLWISPSTLLKRRITHFFLTLSVNAYITQNNTV